MATATREFSLGTAWVKIAEAKGREAILLISAGSEIELAIAEGRPPSSALDKGHLIEGDFTRIIAGAEIAYARGAGGLLTVTELHPIPGFALRPAKGNVVDGHTHTYDSIVGKPATFPPQAHQHAIGDISGLRDELDAIAEADTPVQPPYDDTEIWEGIDRIEKALGEIPAPYTGEELIAQLSGVEIDLVAVRNKAQTAYDQMLPLEAVFYLPEAVDIPAGFVAVGDANAEGLVPISRAALPVALPTIVSTITNRDYSFQQGTYVIDLTENFAGATSYETSPLPANIVQSGDVGQTLIISTNAALPTTTIQVWGRNIRGRSAEAIVWTLRVGAGVMPVLSGGSLTLVVEEPEEPADETVTGAIWVGDYDDTSVTVSAMLLEGTDDVRFAAVPASGPTVFSSVVPIDPTYNFAKTTITGLSAGVAYDIELRTAGGTPSTSPKGWVKTRPTTRQPFALTFSSCGERSRNHPIYEKIWTDNPDSLAFLYLGDRGYFDPETNDYGLFHQYDDEIFGQSYWAYGHRRPTLWSFDDHDISKDNGGSSSIALPAALAFARNRTPIRTHLPGIGQAIYRLFSPMPGVKVAMIDARSERGGSTMISAAQEAWLIGIIQGLASDEALVFCTMVPWQSSASTDTWFGYAAQRQRIADAILAYAPGRVLGFAGDMHANAYVSAADNLWGGFPICHASPLGQITSEKGGPYTIGPIRSTQQQYGRTEWVPIEGGWNVRFIARSLDSDGVATDRIDVSFDLRAPGNAAPSIATEPSISGGVYPDSLLTLDAGSASGSPTPEMTERQWLVNDVDVPGATGPTFLRPATLGAIPGARVKWENGIGSPAIRTVYAAATQAPPSVPEAVWDTFATGATNAQLLQTWTGPSGEAWEKVDAGATNFSINMTNAAEYHGLISGGSGSSPVYRRGAADRGSRHFAEGRGMVGFTGGRDSLSIMARVQGNSGYMWTFNPSTSSTWPEGSLRLRRRVNGSITTLLTIPGPFPGYESGTFAEVLMRIEVDGSQIRARFNDIWTDVVTDTALTGGGIGMAASASHIVSSGGPSATTFFQFRGGSF